MRRLQRESDAKRKQEVEAEAARLVAQGEHKRKVNACREHIESGLGFAIVEGDEVRLSLVVDGS